MDEDILVVASSANERFALGLIVLLGSIVLSNPVPRIRFYIIDDGILPETKDFLTGKIMNLAVGQNVEVQIQFFALSSIPMPGMPVINGSYSMYARMFFSELFEEASIYYVDADVVCNRPFPSLAEMESVHGGQLIAGCEDNEVSVSCDMVWSERHGTGIYVNTGFLWMNLRLMREVGLVKQLREAEDVIARMRLTNFHFRDQTLLNCFCHGRVGVMPGNFNVVGSALHTGARMNPEDNWHFTGEIKPWLQNGKMMHLTVPFWLYHVMVGRLGLADRMPYSSPYLPLSRTKYVLRHLIAARLWFRSRKRFSRFRNEVKCYQDAMRQGALYATWLERLTSK